MNERLEEIKTSTWNICECETCYCENFKPQMIAVDPKHFEWLIQQTERVEELEKVEYALQETYRQEREYSERLEKENQRLKQALERVLDFYPGVPNAEYIPTEMLFEIKNIARKALERDE